MKFTIKEIHNNTPEKTLKALADFVLSATGDTCPNIDVEVTVKNKPSSASCFKFVTSFSDKRPQLVIYQAKQFPPVNPKFHSDSKTLFAMNDFTECLAYAIAYAVTFFSSTEKLSVKKKLSIESGAKAALHLRQNKGAFFEKLKSMP